jgi:thiamine-monophosphate kinase
LVHSFLRNLRISLNRRTLRIQGDSGHDACVALDETAILARIRALLPGGEALTDDCGALPIVTPGTTLLVTTDVMQEGVHFRRDWHPPELLGRKLLAVNLSDLDASGAVATGFTLTLALPPDLHATWLDAFLEGLASGCREWKVPVLGGDTVGSRAGISLGLTAFGATTRWLTRAGLRPGDTLFVDQPLGRSTAGHRKLEAGLRWDGVDHELKAHLDPAPNLGLGARLAAIPEVHACMDLSDGLADDLPRLADASGVTIRLCPAVQGTALDTTAGAALLTAGEDYARCFGSPLAQADLEGRLGVALHPVASVEARREAALIHYDGRLLRARGFDHFAPP